MLEISLPSLRMTWSFLLLIDLSRAVSRFSKSLVAGNHRQHVFDPTGSHTITISDRIEKITVNTFSIQLGQIRLQSPIESKKHMAQLQEITVSSFSIQLGQTRLQSPIGSKRQHFFSI